MDVSLVTAYRRGLLCLSLKYRRYCVVFKSVLEICCNGKNWASVGPKRATIGQTWPGACAVYKQGIIGQNLAGISCATTRRLQHIVGPNWARYPDKFHMLHICFCLSDMSNECVKRNFKHKMVFR